MERGGVVGNKGRIPANKPPPSPPLSLPNNNTAFNSAKSLSYN